ncbi:unnamed protein product [Rhizoctonia solani]|uniref:Prolyl 4-hydroxylase alpha subunit domain-containing protein n=1 Tax=Rhizoctonia solani TaxID=456999 RepID=A0A8H3BSX6_9AGAM|nr:unnamed protein product [Rhizoctonia solani]
MSDSQIHSMAPNPFKGENILLSELQQGSVNPDAPFSVVTNRLDFLKLGLPEYRHKFTMVIDNLFTPEDCARYIAMVESEKEWEVAGVGVVAANTQAVDASYRHSGRILYDNEELASEIFEKLRPYLKDIEYMDHSPLHRNTYKHVTNVPARWVGLNKRLRFLKYGPGQFFRRHYDGTYSTPDRKQISYHTLQLYLNGSTEGLKGGATRFWKMGDADGPEKRKAQPGMPLRRFVDVEPRMGRVLVFEQCGMMHSGEEVTEGTKITIRTDLMFEAYLDGPPKDTIE